MQMLWPDKLQFFTCVQKTLLFWEMFCISFSFLEKKSWKGSWEFPETNELLQNPKNVFQISENQAEIRILVRFTKIPVSFVCLQPRVRNTFVLCDSENAYAERLLNLFSSLCPARKIVPSWNSSLNFFYINLNKNKNILWCKQS